jgi:histone H1/5
VKKPTVSATHPPVSESHIKKYLTATYKVGCEKLTPFIKKFLKNAVADGKLIQTKGKGASGSFKLPAASKKEVAEKKKVAKLKAKNSCQETSRLKSQESKGQSNQDQEAKKLTAKKPATKKFHQPRLKRLLQQRKLLRKKPPRPRRLQLPRSQQLRNHLHPKKKKTVTMEGRRRL